MRRVLSVLLLFPLFLASCATPTEPERCYPVSAVGFDGGERLRVSLEIPLVSGERSGEMKTMVLTGEGESVPAALEQIRAGASKTLEFSHCALMVLGDELTEAQLEAVFDFAGQGLEIPLETVAISAANAESVLREGAAEGDAVGYGVTALLRRLEEAWGIVFRGAIFELRAEPDPMGSTVLPRIGLGEGESGMAVVFRGLRVLLRNREPLEISPEETLAFALLSDRIRGGLPLESSSAATVRQVRTRLSAVLSDGTLCLRLSVKGVLRGEDNGEGERMKQQLTNGALLLFERMRATGADVFSMKTRIRECDAVAWETVAADPAHYFQNARLTVSVEWSERGGER